MAKSDNITWRDIAHWLILSIVSISAWFLCDVSNRLRSLEDDMQAVKTYLRIKCVDFEPKTTAKKESNKSNRIKSGVL